MSTIKDPNTEDSCVFTAEVLGQNTDFQITRSVDDRGFVTMRINTVMPGIAAKLNSHGEIEFTSVPPPHFPWS